MKKYNEIKNHKELNEAIDYLEELGDKGDLDNKVVLDEFERIANVIEEYENKHFPMEPGEPLEIIKLKMEYDGLKRKDLYPNIASKKIILEIFNKEIKLSESIIQKFSELLNIDILILQN
jgi:HTH-type transcriptional regulator / antitoxin HigA